MLNVPFAVVAGEQTTISYILCIYSLYKYISALFQRWKKGRISNFNKAASPKLTNTLSFCFRILTFKYISDCKHYVETEKYGPLFQVKGHLTTKFSIKPFDH